MPNSLLRRYKSKINGLGAYFINKNNAKETIKKRKAE